MNQQTQKIIAEACGWTKVRSLEKAFYRSGGDPSGSWLVGNPPHAKSEEKEWRWNVPDYANDLNAIVAAVKYKIRENTDFSLLKYGDYMIKKHGTHGAITASAKQHCEAFLHTINKWTES